ncbi:hypothetical protein BDA96_07G175000 [Sorghum bicolor]|jgi:hypothetical protein|uniref:Uncharacterized protein n=1 Tax=Sorghum bicolor TaxID=4558 RepID=A0A921UAW2_SORBI|nr:hypothetical protein BDA96_07G175000 [Sorghum bicolor]
MRKGLNSLIILVPWGIWKHCNARVFEGAPQNVQLVLQAVANKSTLWCMDEACVLNEIFVQLLSTQT